MTVMDFHLIFGALRCLDEILGKVDVNDPIERIEGKPIRHNPNRK